MGQNGPNLYTPVTIIIIFVIICLFMNISQHNLGFARQETKKKHNNPFKNKL